MENQYEYIGFDDVVEINWSDPKTALQNGWIIVQDGTVTNGRGKLLEFYEDSQSGQSGWICILTIYPGFEGEENCILRDIFYDGDAYYHAWLWQDEVFWENRGYTQFQILQGNNRTSYVLSNRAELTRHIVCIIHLEQYSQDIHCTEKKIYRSFLL